MGEMRLITGAALLAFALIIGCGDSETDNTGLIEQRIDSLFPTDPSYGTLDRGQLRRMLEIPADEDRPFYMVNVIQLREFAEYPDGRETDLTGAQANSIYSGLVLPILIETGARPVFVASVSLNLINSDGTPWNQISVVRYPSRAQFVQMMEREDFRSAATHKDAGIEKSLVLVAEVEGDGIPDEDRLLDLATVPTPPTADDPPISVIHLLDYKDHAQYADGRETDLTGREAMRLYEQGRIDQGVASLGVRAGLWLQIEGELIGDGRVWDEFRINNFPNRTTFFQVASRESSEEAGIEHREAAIQETYTMLTAPVLTEVGYE